MHFLAEQVKVNVIKATYVPSVITQIQHKNSCQQPFNSANSLPRLPLYIFLEWFSSDKNFYNWKCLKIVQNNIRSNFLTLLFTLKCRTNVLLIYSVVCHCYSEKTNFYITLRVNNGTSANNRNIVWSKAFDQTFTKGFCNVYII